MQMTGARLRNDFSTTSLDDKMLRAIRDIFAVILVLGMLVVLFTNPFVPVAWSMGFLAFSALAWLFFHFVYRRKNPQSPQAEQSTNETR